MVFLLYLSAIFAVLLISLFAYVIGDSEEDD